MLKCNSFRFTEFDLLEQADHSQNHDSWVHFTSMEPTFFPLYTETGQKYAEDHLVCLYTSPKIEFVSRTVLVSARIELILLLSSENSAMF